MTRRTRLLVIVLIAFSSLVLAAWATFGGLLLHEHRQDGRVDAAAIAQYGALHGMTGLEVSRGRTWNRCAVVELSYGSEGGGTVTMEMRNGEWVLATTSTEAHYFDTDDVNDEAACLHPLFH